MLMIMSVSRVIGKEEAGPPRYCLEEACEMLSEHACMWLRRIRRGEASDGALDRKQRSSMSMRKEEPVGRGKDDGCRCRTMRSRKRGVPQENRREKQQEQIRRQMKRRPILQKEPSS